MSVGGIINELSLHKQDYAPWIFRGVCFLFSGVIPLGTAPMASPLWIAARSHGARCVEELDASVTHILASGVTEKVKRALRKGRDVKAVRIEWLYACVQSQRRLSETSFELTVHQRKRDAEDEPEMEEGDMGVGEMDMAVDSSNGQRGQGRARLPKRQHTAEDQDEMAEDQDRQRMVTSSSLTLDDVDEIEREIEEAEQEEEMEEERDEWDMQYRDSPSAETKEHLSESDKGQETDKEEEECEEGEDNYGFNADEFHDDPSDGSEDGEEQG